MSLDMKVKKDFGGFVLDLELHAENEVLALLGASGCGKSMTLKCIAGIVTPDEGYIRVNGKTLFDSRQKINLPPQKRHVGLLFQNYALFPNMTVEQNIMMGMTGFDLPKAEKRQRAREMMKSFYLDGLEQHRPSQLSGGQQQRVALARIMVSRPSILMLDEPFSALDSFLRWELEKELMKVLESFDGTSIIVSHNRDEVYRISDHIAVIVDGHKDCFDSKENLFENPPTYQSAKLTGFRNFTRVERIDDSHFRALDWDAVLPYPTDEDTELAALRPEPVQLSAEMTDDTVCFRVGKAIDNINEMILLLTPQGNDRPMDAADDFSWLHVTVKKEDFAPFAGKNVVNVKMRRHQLLMIRRSPQYE